MSMNSIRNGIYGGVAGGLVFGVMMGMMGMLPMIGKMAGHPSVVAGFLIHMVNSAIIGAGFALVVGRWSKGLSRGLRSGLLYGGVWWLLGPLTLMPLFMGMGLGVNWNVSTAVAMMPSLMGHLVYGAILGGTFGSLQSRDGAQEVARSHTVPVVGDAGQR